MQQELLKSNEYEHTMDVINNFCTQKITRKLLLENLATNIKADDIMVLRYKFREQVIQNLKVEMKYLDEMLISKKQFQKKFILYEGLQRYLNLDQQNTK